MRAMVEKILRGYGKNMVLRHDGAEHSVKAFWQVATGKSEKFAKLQPGITGLEDSNQFVYIGPVEPEATVGDELIVDGVYYLVRNAQTICGGSEDVYVWGICVEKRGAPNWDVNGCK